MTQDLTFVVYSALLLWIMLLTASLLRSRGWTPRGLMLGLGNRDDLPEPTPMAARADRAAKNMLENLVLFAALVFSARLAGVPSEQVAPGAGLFFWARVVYFPLYLVGIKLARTVAWAVAIAGMLQILRTLL